VTVTTGVVFVINHCDDILQLLVSLQPLIGYLQICSLMTELKQQLIDLALFSGKWKK